MFNKILIANRGEIAIRVIRTAKKMGIKTVAVYSDADKNSEHVRLADEAVYIGASPATESYLKQDKILEAAKRTNSDAIHPGYGFLSENSDFSQLCAENNIVFIGPRPEAINTMGDKITARKTMIAAGVPVVPGVENFKGSNEQLIELAKQIGFPVMVKATAGGGGKGMRLVENPNELISAVEMAKGEAKSAFGNETVYIEKFVSSPHHIEFQILADNYGNVIHINERECSVQRRHQKVIEETPSPLMTSELRQKMGQAAVQAAKSVNYTGAGTVEFLVDDDLNFYFLEMNTRLQVEHPITEMTSGLDLVEYQIKIAAGEKLDLQQQDIKQNGHAIECRIYAEDTENNFMPSPGLIHYVNEPKGKNIRIDGYIKTGYEVPIYYDPMLSKLIVWNKNRQKAIEKMKSALKNYKILGVKTNIAYLHKILNHPNFEKGKYDTRFVSLYKDDIDKISYKTDENKNIVASVVFTDYWRKADFNLSSLNFNRHTKKIINEALLLKIDDEEFNISLLEKTGICNEFKINDSDFNISLRHVNNNEYYAPDNDLKIAIASLSKNAMNYEISVELANYKVQIITPAKKYFLSRNIKSDADAGNIITTPMPGKIVKILAKEGDIVKEGDNIIIVEAMKMQSEYKAPSMKRVSKILVAEGDAIDGNQPLVLLEDIQNN